MAREYSIAALLAVAASGAFAAAPCPTELAAVAARIAVMRSVPPPFSPPCRTIAAADLRAELDRKLRRDLSLPPDLLLEALVRTGMAAGDPPELYRRLLDFYGSQVLGFYEPRGDEMVLVEGGTAAGMPPDMVWAHEMAHAAQEHRFRLPSRLLGMREDGDRQRAASAIAEGEAMLVMMLVEDAGSDVDTRLATAARALTAQAATFTAPEGIPDYFVQDLLFPYTAGFAAVLGAYRDGGWAAVDRLLAAPPPATALLLYPELGKPGPAIAEGELPPLPPGWEPVLLDTLGAWGLRFWLSRAVPADEAARLAAHWDADRLRLARRSDAPGCWALAWRLRCRNEAGRGALEGVLQRHLPRLVTGLCPADAPPGLTWLAAGPTLEVRVGWPGTERDAATSSPPPPSPS